MHTSRAVAVSAAALFVFVGACHDDETSPHPSTSSTATGAGAAGGGGAGGAPAEVTWAKCDTIDWPDDYPPPPSNVQCASIDVPADPAWADGPTVTLRVARQKSAAFPTGNAVFELSGGPGGSSVVESSFIGMFLPTITADRDMVYIDLRGTGGSHYLDCPDGYPGSAEEWEACSASLASEPLDHDLSVDAASDIDVVRKRLGYDRISIYGGSYGTRTGLEYIRQHGDHVESAVFDGLAPPDADLLGDDVRSIGKGVSMLDADCAADPACAAITDSVEDDLAAVYAQRVASPEPVLINGQPNVEDGDTLKQLLQQFMLDSFFRYKIPRAIHEARGGDPSAWYALASDLYGVTISDNPPDAVIPFDAPSPWRPQPVRRPYGLTQSPVSPGLYETVTCAEVYPNSGGLAALVAEEARQTWIAPSSIVEFVGSCDGWPVHPIDASLRSPVVSDVPVLLLSGAIDLQTFAENGAHALETLSHGTHIVIPYSTHGTIQTKCSRDILQGFVEASGDMSGVDTSCIGTLQHATW